MKKMFALISALVLLGVLVPARRRLRRLPPPAATQAPAAAEPTAAPAAAETLDFATVVKIAGIDWFNRMEVGVEELGKETGIKASLVGPAQADAAKQIPMIEDLIAQEVDALCVIPMDPAQLEPVLKKAMDAGIAVITHEASNQQNMDWDIEAFDNTAFGAGLMDRLAAGMGEEGEYAVFVGSLGSKTHNEWVDGGIDQQKAKYPNMKMVGDKNESFDDAAEAYEKAKEILKRLPEHQGLPGQRLHRRGRHRPGGRRSGPAGQDRRRRHQPALARRRPADERRHRRHRWLGSGRGRQGLQQARPDADRRRDDRRRHEPRPRPATRT